MKKVLVLVLSVVLVFSFGVFAFAADQNSSFRVYGDLMPIGSYSVNASATLSAPGYTSASLFDVSATAPCFLASGGVEYLANGLKLGGEIGVGTSTESVTSGLKLYATNIDYYMFKGGYRILNGQFILDADATYFMGDFNVPTTNSKTSFSGIMIGANASCSFSPQIVFDGYYDFSVSASAKTDGITYGGKVNVSRLGLNLNYILSDTLSLAAGYHITTFSESNTYDSGYVTTYGDPISETDKSGVSYGGLTFGIKAKF